MKLRTRVARALCGFCDDDWRSERAYYENMADAATEGIVAGLRVRVAMEERVMDYNHGNSDLHAVARTRRKLLLELIKEFDV